MRNQDCAGCRFRFEGHCHKNPPVAAHPGGHGYWPVVAETDWCGEWQGKRKVAHHTAEDDENAR